jgi:hypothetical protein
MHGLLPRWVAFGMITNGPGDNILTLGQQAVDLLRGNIRELNSSGFQCLDRDAIVAWKNTLRSFSENSDTKL